MSLSYHIPHIRGLKMYCENKDYRPWELTNCLFSLGKVVHEEVKRNGEKWEVSGTLVLYKNNVSVQTHTECKSSCFQADGGNIKIDSLNKIIADFCVFLYCICHLQPIVLWHVYL